MLHSVPHFGAFGVVETVNGAYKIPGDPPDTLYLHTLPDLPADDGEAVP